MAIDFGEALSQVPAPPDGGPALVAYAGGRVAFTRAYSGLAGPPSTALKRGTPEEQARYVEEARRWKTAQTAARRADNVGTGKQSRPARAARERLEDEARTAKFAKALGDGLRVRIRARFQVSKDERDRTMPAPGGPGVFINTDDTDDLITLLEHGAAVEADRFFWERFMVGYQMDEADAAGIIRVYWVKVWAATDPEPPLQT